MPCRIFFQMPEASCVHLSTACRKTVKILWSFHLLIEHTSIVFFFLPFKWIQFILTGPELFSMVQIVYGGYPVSGKWILIVANMFFVPFCFLIRQRNTICFSFWFPFRQREGFKTVSGECTMKAESYEKEKHKQRKTEREKDRAWV